MLHLLNKGAKPSKERQTRKKHAILQFSPPEDNKDEEEKGGAPDKSMNDETFKDVNHLVRKSKRNKTATDNSLV